MDYLTAMTNSPVYEFPYSGSHASSIPFLNYNPNQYSNYEPYNTSPMVSHWGNNTTVYHLPDNIPLDAILRELGVNVGALNPSSSSRHYYANSSTPIDFVFPPSRPRHRRRVVCMEVTDSESDNDSRHTSPYHHRRRHHHYGEYDQQDRSPKGVHNLLDHVWQGAKRSSRSNARPATNPPWSSTPSGGAAGSFGAMNQSPPLAPQQYQQAGPNQSNPAVANMWNRSNNPGQYGQASNSNPPWNQMSGTSPPSTQAPVAMHSLWSRMAGAPPPQQQSPPPFMNSPWNQMSGSAPPSQQQQQQPPTAVNSLWSRMAAAPSPPQQPFQPPPPQQQQQPPPAANSLWSRMAGASSPPQQPPPPPFQPPPQQQQPPPAANSVWSRMAGASPPQQPPAFQQPPYSSPPMGASPQGPYSSGPSPAITALFGQGNPSR